MEKTIEIPFGAKDSELKGWEYTIPEGMEARIDGNKVILEPKESEDERIKKEIVGFLDMINKDSHEARIFIADRYGDAIPDDMIPTWIAWLEKQGSQNLANSAKTCKVEQNPAWSEEDENMVDNINKAIQHLLKENDSWGFLEECLEWLKALKERHAWKPSDEQMEILRIVTERSLEDTDEKEREIVGTTLGTLCDDLEKLKG